MRCNTPAIFAICGFTIAAWLLPATAIYADEPERTTIRVDAKPHAVTLYRGRASVTRHAALTLDPGVYEVQFDHLPESLQPSTLQANASGAAKVLGVDFGVEAVAEATSEPIKQLDAEIKQLQAGLAEIEQQRGVIKVQEDFINAIGVRASADASDAAGDAKLDLDELRKQMRFIAEERGRLLAERRELDNRQRDLNDQLQIAQAKRQTVAGTSIANRIATVLVTSTQGGDATIDLTYLVDHASWEPTYDIRADLAGSAAHIDYNALLVQRTGEAWENVTLTLSTAQPMVAANPPTIQPLFIDVFKPAPSAPASEMEAFERRAAMPMDADRARNKFEEMAADAAVHGGGPSVTFLLPRTVTVKTNAQKQQSTRIASIDGQPRFEYVAVPLLTDGVYLRGTLVNTSLFQLLPGRASVFVGQDFVGPTQLESVAPNGEFKIHFGIDNTVKAMRRLVSKRTENTGLLSGGRRTTYEYRLTLDNGSGKPIVVELWDRHPVSQSSEIQVEVFNMTDPLSNDAYYVAEEKPRGLLKWILNVPTAARDASAQVISYTVAINRAKDTELSPLPE